MKQDAEEMLYDRERSPRGCLPLLRITMKKGR